MSDDPDPIGPVARMRKLQEKAEGIEATIKSREATEPESGAQLDDSDSSSVPTQDYEESTSAGLAAVALRQQQLKLKQRKQDMKLRRFLAICAIWLVIAQVAVANILFSVYLAHNVYDPDSAVLIAWLSATVVEVVGILWVIARNLFPYRDKSLPRSPKDSKREG